ncbi:hypothetical protein HAX54_033259 [Datura stramonium]|uniref:Protein phosphatase n=1 Tax=Datura stramonium TaxID=4076 RepID=A0ABS8VC35_DATST|nr:hypothetical protein [Datura stramonium]
MAVSIFRPSVSHPQNSLYSTNSPKISSISDRKRKSFLHCASSDSAPPTRQEVSLSVGMYLIPHPNKVEKGGEDAFFVSSDNGGVIAVADGVSGWAEKNVDPALFSREFVANVSSLVGNGEVNYDPRILIKGAHAATSSTGSATVIVSILENGILKIASVGDCGLRIIRKGQMIFSTFPLEHYFDCPYQLSSEAVTQTYLDAIVSTVDLQVGDTIIIGTDGLFDNVFDKEIVSVVTEHDDVSNAAKALADLARNHSVDTKFDSPFSLEARARGFDVPWWKKVFGMKLTGGKLDDITVIVGKVKST